MVKVLCYNSEGRWFDPSWCHWIFYWQNPSDRTMALGSTQPLTEMSTRSTSWGQRRPVRLADNLPPSCAVVTKSGNLNFLEPSGPVQACNRTALPFFLHILEVMLKRLVKLHWGFQKTQTDIPQQLSSLTIVLVSMSYIILVICIFILTVPPTASGIQRCWYCAQLISSPYWLYYPSIVIFHFFCNRQKDLRGY